MALTPQGDRPHEYGRRKNSTRTLRTEIPPGPQGIISVSGGELDDYLHAVIRQADLSRLHGRLEFNRKGLDGARLSVLTPSDGDITQRYGSLLIWNLML